MKKDFFKIAIRNLKSRSLRSWLTIFGFVIGVFMIIALLSLSEGMKQVVMNQMKMMGSDTVMITPGDSDNLMNTMIGNMKISEENIKTIEKTNGVEKVIAYNWKGETMRYNGDKKTIIFYGLPLDTESIFYLETKFGIKVAQGRFPEKNKRELLIGPVVVKEVFPGIKIGDEAYIAGTKFKVVGIARAVGNKQDDSMVALDLDLFRQITGERKDAPMVVAIIKDGYDQKIISDRIKTNLEETGKRQRGSDSPSFSVINSEKAMETAGNVLGTIQGVVFAIAGFAILIGAIGIMNTMYTSVRERTKEIGIMKAVGAKTTDISKIFLIEAGVMGLIGGVGGMILGVGAAKLSALALNSYGSLAIEAYVSPGMIIYTIVFAIAVGMVSGYLPARKAARLSPVDALRYE